MLHLKTIRNQTIGQKCIACGHDTTIPKTIHKITTFILNHPPDQPANAPASSKTGKASKADRKSSKKNGTAANSHQGGDSGNGDDSNAFNGNNDDDFDQFDDDELTTAAYSERLRGLCDGFNNALYLNDSKESSNIFYALVKEKRDANLLLDPVVQKEVLKEAERLNIRTKSKLILCELLFTENIMQEIKTHKMLLLRFCHENKKAQKYLLGGFEKIIGEVYKEQLLNNAMKILKQFYDEDILDEEILIEWAGKESKKYVSKEISRKIREKVAPFIKWLKEAEIEEESDEEEAEGGDNNSKENQNGSLEDEDENEDDGIDLEFSHRVSGIEVKEVKPATQIKPVNADAAHAEGEDDLDIDNI